MTTVLVQTQDTRHGLPTPMSRIELNAPAPGFTLTDANGMPVSLESLLQKDHVVLVFNRGFT